ncbi:phosphatidylinositol-specific phospholipase C1-like protein [Luteibacter rhizovicinus]|uniref:phosphatidylinositol-specific phospholipase C1-like protein n=1 Tax=Luteibacter rhizovicinus TaxID=242606 RepID=UPI000ACCFB1A|nr:phosphatidylinositol-specific phospholipase C1-like protein [Luteibacter rhizovicinus]
MLALRTYVLPIAAAVSLVASASLFAATSDIRINQIQVIGTHNSYHAGFAPSARRVMQKEAPKEFFAIDYSHPSLTRQLDDGVRQVELDVFSDAKGGLYLDPAIDHMIALNGLPADPPTAAPGTWEKPGFKVMHIQGVDQRSTCQPFTACLAELRAWSKAHPGHTPLFVLIETKQEPLKAKIPTATPELFTPAVFDALDAEIASVFPRNEMVVPDDVRGRHASLDEAVREGGWPTMDKASGKVVFLLDQRKMESVYSDGHPSLRGRLIFTNATPGADDAAFTECNECSADEINALVRRGYIVRARTDDPAQGQGLKNDGSRRDVVLSSGAQLISTDYPAGEPSEHGYSVGFPGGVTVRCNPVLTKKGQCMDAALGAVRK